jgi:mRNA-degrading endonuclease RelE of RelBE toxin-antitoxin system
MMGIAVPASALPEAALASPEDPEVLERLEDPHLPGTAPLHCDLKGRRKLRVGDYRVVYSVGSEASAVRITAIGHRAKVYRDAARRE